eukprot:363254-Chlamydomonas_euryale.AAC.6
MPKVKVWSRQLNAVKTIACVVPSEPRLTMTVVRVRVTGSGPTKGMLVLSIAWQRGSSSGQGTGGGCPQCEKGYIYQHSGTTREDAKATGADQ